MQIRTNATGAQSRCPKILDIRVDDPAVIEELATRDTLEAQRDYGEELMELGARVARTQRPVSDAQRVTQAFEEFEQRAEHRLRAINERIEDQVESTQARVSSLVAAVTRDTQTQQQSVARLQEQTERSLKELLEGLEDGVQRAEGDSDKLAKLFKDRLQATLSGLKAEVRRAEQVIASGLKREQALLEKQELHGQTSQRKGVEFEKLIFNDLLRFGTGRSDLVERTGATPSAGTSSKKGDLFYQLQVGDRHVPIAIECKDRQLTMSGADPFCLTELEASMKERSGKYGIVVANLKQNSKADGTPRFPVLQPFGDDRFVVLVDREQEHPVALETVLRLIHRAETVEQAKEKSTLDMGAVSQTVETMVRTSSRLHTLKGTFTNLVGDLSAMGKVLDSIDDDLKGQTQQLQSLLGLAA